MSLRYHEPLLGEPHTKDACCSGAAEGVTGKPKLAFKRACKLRNLYARKSAFYHALSVLLGHVPPLECSSEPKNCPNLESIILPILFTFCKKHQIFIYE